MTRRGQQGDPIDWVTRAADDAIRHAGEGNPVTVASGASPERPDPPGQPARVHHPALRRRGAASPRRRGPPPASLGRLRPLPQGAGRRAAGVGRAHRPAADRRPRPVGAATPAGPSTSRPPCRPRSRELGVEMDEISQTEMYTSGAYREQILHAIRHRDDIEAVLGRYRTKKAAPAGRRDRGGGRRAGRVGRQRRGGGGLRAAPARSRASPTSRYCAECGRDTTDVTAYDDDTTDAGLHLPRVRPRRRHRLSPPSTAASWSGRSTGRCAGPTRGSTSSPPASTT